MENIIFLVGMVIGSIVVLAIPLPKPHQRLFKRREGNGEPSDIPFALAHGRSTRIVGAFKLSARSTGPDCYVNAVVEELQLTPARERELLGAAFAEIEEELYSDEVEWMQHSLVEGLVKNPTRSERVEMALSTFLHQRDGEAPVRAAVAAVVGGWKASEADQALIVEKDPYSLGILAGASTFTWPGGATVRAYQEAEEGQDHLSKVRSTVDAEVWDALVEAWSGTVDELVEACHLV